MNNILVRSYVEDGYQPIPYVRLSDDDYARALQSVVVACTDIVPINRAHKLIYLASRQSKPMTGWWWIGGKMVPGDSMEGSAVKNFKRETLLELDPARLSMVSIFHYRWKDRSQEPQEIGCHMLGHTFVTELMDDEIAYVSRNLETKEYASGGLSSFDRARLIGENVFPAVLDLYDQVFPPTTTP